MVQKGLTLSIRTVTNMPRHFLFKKFDKSNSVLLDTQGTTKEGLPIGIWFNKGYSDKTEGKYIRIQLTFLREKKEGGITREWIDPPTFCSVEAFQQFINALILMTSRSIVQTKKS